MDIATNISSLQSNASNPSSQRQLSITAIVTSIAVLSSVIVFGNLACISIFIKNQSLRRKSHYLIISLSVADLCVGGVAFMSIYYHIHISEWYQINTFVISLDFLDSLTSNASITTLVSISLERLYAIVYPFRHRRLRFRHYLICVIICWLISLIISFPRLLVVFDRPTVVPMYRWPLTVTPVLAVIVLSFSYISIAVRMRKKSPAIPNQNCMLRDQKLAVTLVIVTLASLVTWLPLQCFGALLYFCPSCISSVKINFLDLVYFIKFLQYCNSAINVFLYIVRMPEFRHAFISHAFHCASRDSSHPPTTRRLAAIMAFRNRSFELTEMSYGKNKKLDSEISQHNLYKLDVQLQRINDK